MIVCPYWLRALPRRAREGIGLQLAARSAGVLLRRGCQRAMENRALQHGKRINRTFAQAETDRPYCAWVLRAPSLQQSSLRIFQFYLRQRHGGFFTVGRHKGEWFDEVFANDPAYTSWVASLPEPSGDLLGYQSFAAAAVQAASRSSSRSPRRRRGTKAQVTSVEPGDADPIAWPHACLVCFDRPVRSLFRGCGHAVACTRCALEIAKRGCPICRQPVRDGDVVRIFAS